MSPPLVLCRVDRHCAIITLNRVEARNSINSALLKELTEHLARAEAAVDVSVIVLQGQNGLFSTGMDFSEIARLQVPEVAEHSQAWCELYFRTLRRIAESPKIVIAAVDGQAVAGGVGLIAAADLVIATPRSSFSLPEILWAML